MQFDEATSRRVEATYTTPDVAGQRRVIRAALGLKPGEDVLDIGSGPGFLASEMSAEVGPGGSVIGVDPSPSMLAIACGRPQAAELGPGRVQRRRGHRTAMRWRLVRRSHLDPGV